MNSPRINQKVGFICGARHSGSTLLGLILGSHSQCFYGGEVGKTLFLSQPDAPLRQRRCKLCGAAPCPVWHDLEPREDVDWYEQLSQKTHKPVVIDSTKKTDWLAQQIRVIQSTSATPYLIFIQRDGRAVVNSRIRKFPERDSQDIIQEWMTRIQQTKALFTQFPHRKLSIHYEELSTHPEAVVRNVCECLEIDYEPTMLRYYEQEHHVLGGNDGTQFLLTKAQTHRRESAVIELSERRKQYYQGHSLDIQLDLRWKDEMDPKVEQLFNCMAGDVNRDLQWEA
jgi:hypothetical protein